MKKAFFLFFFLIILILGCTFTESEQVKNLRSVEVREYEGKDLSSVGDFRENSILGPQNVDIETYSLNVHGLVDNSKNYTYDEVLNHQAYSKVVTLYCVEGWDVTILWEGILLKDILNDVGVQEGANTVIFYAEDGYSSSLPLDYILNSNIILAYKQNNQTLLPERGFPFQLVAEDRYGYKWVKWITDIEISNNTDYEGFWESRGYSNSGSLDAPKFG